MHEEELKFDSEFIEAIQKSKSLHFLILDDILIEEQKALKLLESQLKGINVDYLRVNQQTKDQIYCKIPKIEYYGSILDFENIFK